jgi:hypothetical protein
VYCQEVSSAPIASEELSKKHIATTVGITAIGTIAARELLTRGSCVLFINSRGSVELVPYHEITLDALSDDQAIQKLLSLGYTDQQLLTYLGGRDTRRKANQHG